MQGGCAGTETVPTRWEDLTDAQPREFSENIVRAIGPHGSRFRPELALADSPFFRQVALGPCGEDRRGLPETLEGLLAGVAHENLHPENPGAENPDRQTEPWG